MSALSFKLCLDNLMRVRANLIFNDLINGLELFKKNYLTDSIININKVIISNFIDVDYRVLICAKIKKLKKQFLL